MHVLWKRLIENLKTRTTYNFVTFIYLNRKSYQSQYIKTNNQKLFLWNFCPFISNKHQPYGLPFSTSISFHGHILLCACKFKAITLPLLRPTLSKWRSTSVSKRHTFYCGGVKYIEGKKYNKRVLPPTDSWANTMWITNRLERMLPLQESKSYHFRKPMAVCTAIVKNEILNYTS